MSINASLLEGKRSRETGDIDFIDVGNEAGRPTTYYRCQQYRWR